MTAPIAWRHGDLVVFADSRLPRVDDRDVPLSYREALVLRCLAEADGAPVAADDILASIGTHAKTPLKVTLSTLRAKLDRAGVDGRGLVVRGQAGAYRLASPGVPLSAAQARGLGETSGHDALERHGLRFDPNTRVLGRGAREVTLSARAAAVLTALRDQTPLHTPATRLARTTANIRFDPRAVASIVWQIRAAARKLGVAGLIEVQAKSGYRLAPPEHEDDAPASR